MARKDALLRLHRRLVAQRDDLRRKLAFQFEAARHGDAHGDSGDVAQFDTEQELESQLAALESRELWRIDRAISAIQNGTYGDCEYCGQKIPVARLQALPHTSCCIECQRQQELQTRSNGVEADWESAWEFQARENDRELTLRDIQIETD